MRHRSPILVFPPRSFSWCALSSLGRAWSSCHGPSSSQASCSCSFSHLLHHHLNHGDVCPCCPSFFCPAWGNRERCGLFLHNYSKFCSCHLPMAGTFFFWGSKLKPFLLILSFKRVNFLIMRASSPSFSSSDEL